MNFVSGERTALHGAAIASPAWRLVRALSTLVDDHGRLTLDDLAWITPGRAPEDVALVEEAARHHDLAAYAELRQFPIIPCDLCGSQPTLQRKQIKAMLREWEKRYIGRVESTFRALADVRLSHLMDRGAFDFAHIAATGQARPDGDKAFDREEEFVTFAHPE